MSWDLNEVPNPTQLLSPHLRPCDIMPHKLMGRNPLECAKVFWILWITKQQMGHPASGGLYRHMLMSPQYRNHKSTSTVAFGTRPLIFQASNWALPAAVHVIKDTLQNLPHLPALEDLPKPNKCCGIVITKFRFQKTTMLFKGGPYLQLFKWKLLRISTIFMHRVKNKSQ